MIVEMKVEIDTESRIAIVSVQGSLNMERMLGLRDTLRAHPDYEADMSVLYDLSGVPDWGQIPGSMVTRVDNIVRTLNEHSVPFSPCLAIVVPTDVAFGIARMYTAVAAARIPDPDDTPKQRGVFRDREEALSWLKAQGSDLLRE